MKILLEETLGSGSAMAALLLLAKASLLLLAAAGLSRALARGSAALRHLVWSAALFGLLLLPSATALAPRLPLPVLPEANPSTGWSLAPPEIDAGPVAARSAAAAPVRLPTLKVQAPAVRPGSPGRLLLGLTASLSLLLAAYLGLGVLRVARLSRRAAPMLDDDGWRGLLERERRRLGIRRPVQLRRTDELAVPSTWGLWRPCILLPAEARGWSASWRRDVLVHELAHVQRWDWPLHLGARLACALYWFHPLVWLAHGRLALEAERACDDRVLLSGASDADYARRLLDLSQRSAGKGLASAGVLAMARRARLSRRIDFILDPHQRRTTMKRFEILLGASLSLLLLAGLGGLQPVEARPGDDDDAGFLVEVLHPVDEGTPLMAAARDGDREAARALLAAGVDPDEGRPGQGTPLILAARQGHREVVELLLAYGADPEAVETDPARPADLPRSPLGAAARDGRADVVARLLSEGVPVDQAPPGDASPLMLAAAEGHVEAVRTLLDYGADVDLVVPGDGTPLIAAARSGERFVVQVLLDAGADPHLEVDGDGTALQAAVEAEAPAVVEVLLHATGATLSGYVEAVNGASVDTARPEWSLTTEKLLYTVEAGAERNDGTLELHEVEIAPTGYRVQSGRDDAAVHVEAGDGRSEQQRIVELLLAAGADPNQAVQGDGTPLIAAARTGNLPLVRQLLDAGADVNGAVPGDGNPLIMAAAAGYLDVVRLLVESGADIDRVVPGNENALISAAAAGHGDVVRYLLDSGADPGIAVRTDGEVRTALSQARRGGHQDVIDLLQGRGAR